MSKPTRRLGRGLDSLVSNFADQGTMPVEVPQAPSLARTGVSPTPASGPGIEAKMAAIGVLTPNPFQPRTACDNDSMSALAGSIARSGLLQPIVVRQCPDGYEIIAGERRWTAAKSLNMSHVPIVIRDATDEQMLELALVENLQREDLNPIDRAAAYRDFCERFSLRPEEVARRLGEDRTTVINYIRILELPQDVQELVQASKLSMGHARCLLSITGDVERMQLAQSVVDNELSVRALEEIVRREKTRRSSDEARPPRSQESRPAHVLDLQRRFEQAVKTKVLIHQGKRKGTGRIIIEYYSLDDFDRIASMLAVPEE